MGEKEIVKVDIMEAWTAEQEDVMREVVRYWQEEDRGGIAAFTEQDVQSLFNVISGHFLAEGSSTSQSPSFQPTAGAAIHQCPVPDCGRWFDQPYALVKHQNLTHNKEKSTPFQCSHCEKSFIYEVALKKHIRKNHEDMTDKIVD